MRYARNVCHHCHGTETDPRRLIRIEYPFSPLRMSGQEARGPSMSGSESRAPGHERPGPHYTLTTHVTHVACFLEAGGSIDGLSDSQLWHVPTRLWQRLGYLPGDSREEYARVQEEERDAARRAAHASSPPIGGEAAREARGVRGSQAMQAHPLTQPLPLSGARSMRRDARRPVTRELRRAA